MIIFNFKSIGFLYFIINHHIQVSFMFQSQILFLILQKYLTVNLHNFENMPELIKNKIMHLFLMFNQQNHQDFEKIFQKYQLQGIHQLCYLFIILYQLNSFVFFLFLKYYPQSCSCNNCCNYSSLFYSNHQHLFSLVVE